MRSDPVQSTDSVASGDGFHGSERALLEDGSNSVEGFPGLQFVYQVHNLVQCAVCIHTAYCRRLPDGRELERTDAELRHS